MKRYPGLTYFTSDQHKIFYGRENDVKELYQLLKLRKQVVLYSKSGLGKTSLLNAGLGPELEKEKHTVLKIRFTNYVKDQAQESKNQPQEPVARILSILKRKTDLPASTYSLLQGWEDDPALNDSLWIHFKNIQLNQPKIKFLLIFDQFEEIFTYPPELLDSFKSKIYDLLQDGIPDGVLQAIYEKYNEEKDAEELDALSQKMDIKVIFAIRSDKLNLLNSLTDKIPDIQSVFFELKPLTHDQALDAILKPAKLEDNSFETQSFEISESALAFIISELTKQGNQSIESTQLQIICQEIENKAIETQAGQINDQKIVIEQEDLPKFTDLLYNFYETTISKTRNPAASRKFIEEYLIMDELRILLDERICIKYLSSEDLHILVNGRLIRREQSSPGVYHYELSHDALIEPIMRAKEARLGEETNEALKREIKTLQQENKALRKSIGNTLVSSGRLEHDNILATEDYNKVDVADVSAKMLVHKRYPSSIQEQDDLYQVFKDFAPATEVMLSFRDASGNPCKSTDGVFALAMKYDEKKRIVQLSYYNQYGQRMINKRGNHGFNFEFDDFDNEIQKTSIDKAGCPIRLKNGYATIRTEYDAHNNPIKVTYYDENDQACIHYESNHGYISKFDAYGNEIRRSFIDLDGKRTITYLGYSIIKMEYTKIGLTSSKRFYDVEAKPCYDIFGNHGELNEYDDEGRIIKRTLIDLDGKIMVSKEGYSIVKYEYNVNDQLELERLFDQYENPTLNKDGIHAFHSIYDEKERIYKQTHCDLSMQPAASKLGIVSIQLEYDELGRTSAYLGLGINSNPSFNHHKHVKAYGYKLDFDPLGRIQKQNFLDIFGRPSTNLDGLSIVDLKYDESGRIIERSFYDKNNQPVIIPEGGYHRENYEYFEFYKAIVTNSDLSKTRVESYEVEFDIAWRWKSSKILDEKGNPIPEENTNIYQREYKHDNHGNITEIRYFDENHEPAEDTSGNFGLRKIYQEDIVIELQHLGPDGQLFLNKNNCAIEQYEFDAKGNLITTLYLDPERKPIANSSGEHGLKINYWSDESALVKTYTSLNEEKLPTNNLSGYAFLELEYDEYGNKTKVAHFNIQHEPVSGPERYHCWEASFGDQLLADLSYYDTQHNLVDYMGNYATRKQTVKKFWLLDDQIIITYTKSTGERGVGDEGYSKIVLDKDHPDRVLVAFDSNGKKVLDNRKKVNDVFKAIFLFLFLIPFSLWYLLNSVYSYISKKIATYMETKPVSESTTSIIVAATIYEKTVAKTMGLEDGMLILEYGDWSYFNGETDQVVSTFEAAFNHLGSKAKTLLFGYRSSDEYKFFYIDFSDGKMGMRITDQLISVSEAEKLKQDYLQWKSK